MEAKTTHPGGVFCAALTPMTAGGGLDLSAVGSWATHLIKNGCNGILWLGTTGEGQSLSLTEKQSLLSAASQAHRHLPGSYSFAGTGSPSIEETISLTRLAFDLGFDGVLVLPPYYYRKPSEDGLFDWFSKVIQHAVPASGRLYAYHIPQLTGIPFSIELLSRLKDSFPVQMAGLKDSSGDAEFAIQLGQNFGTDLQVFTGNDGLFLHALQNKAQGCITALANLLSPLHQRIWQAYQAGKLDQQTQQILTAARNVMDANPPPPATLKSWLAMANQKRAWSVKPPLLTRSAPAVMASWRELQAILDQTDVVNLTARP